MTVGKWLGVREPEAEVDAAVCIDIAPGRIIVQYRPGLDPVGRHWDEAVKCITAGYPNLDACAWEQLDEPVLTLEADTEEETQWFVMELEDSPWGLTGQLRSMSLEEQVLSYLQRQRETRCMGAMPLVLTFLLTMTDTLAVVS